MHKKRRGFTLIELMMVITIMGILAGVAVPKVFGYIDSAKIASDIQILASVNTAVSVDAVAGPLSKTLFDKNETFRIRLSDAAAHKAVAGFEYNIEGAIIKALDDNMGKNFINIATSHNDGDALFSSPKLQQQAPYMMFVIGVKDGSIQICTIATATAGGSSSISIPTWRGRAVAAGNVPVDGETWGDATFTYKEME